MQKIPHKRGDTFSVAYTYQDADAARDLTLATVACHVNESDGTAVQEFTISDLVANDEGYVSATISATAAECADWPTGELRADVQITLGAVQFSSETFGIVVTRDETIT